MSQKRILLMHITKNSGHHRASLAMEKAIKELSPEAEVLNINAFNYVNPVLEKIINRAYMGVIKKTPEVWDYLYDNPKVYQKVKKLRTLLHKFNSEKLGRLLEDFKPHCIACTQAFPCGLIADLKKSHSSDVPLLGVLTDYAPHFYWVYEMIDFYIVPASQARDKLIESGIPQEKIRTFGIPIDPKFKHSSDKRRVLSGLGLAPFVPVVLIMGGGQGMGPIKQIVQVLEGIDLEFQMLVVCGTNSKLLKWFQRKAHKGFKKKVVAFGFVKNIDELMDASNFIITKPGGLTTAEALSKGLPMMIVEPIPGQEANNTKFLMEIGAAIRIDQLSNLVTILKQILDDSGTLQDMSLRARRYGKPEAAADIAKFMLGL